MRVLVDTGMTEPHPAVADLDPASVHWQAGLRPRWHQHIVNTPALRQLRLALKLSRWLGRPPGVQCGLKRLPKETGDSTMRGPVH